MQGITYQERRSEIETYFDRTAMAAWAALTSTAPVGKIRAKVRAGRETMRNTLLSWMPDDMTGMRLLDAGCGTGMLSMDAAARGAEVVAIDLSPQLVALAAERASGQPGAERIHFSAGDMLAKSHGNFDYIVCMDSIIHYDAVHAIDAIKELRSRARRAVLFTFAPRTALLNTALTMGKLFPRKDRSPMIVPQNEANLRRQFPIARSRRISASFYTSQAMESPTC